LPRFHSALPQCGKVFQSAETCASLWKRVVQYGNLFHGVESYSTVWKRVPQRHAGRPACLGGRIPGVMQGLQPARAAGSQAPCRPTGTSSRQALHSHPHTFEATLKKNYNKFTSKNYFKSTYKGWLPIDARKYKFHWFKCFLAFSELGLPTSQPGLWAGGTKVICRPSRMRWTGPIPGSNCFDPPGQEVGAHCGRNRLYCTAGLGAAESPVEQK
jgi:hypothetical protein